MERRGEVMIVQHERRDNPCDTDTSGDCQPGHDVNRTAPGDVALAWASVPE
jgi:hypothetical protein